MTKQKKKLMRAALWMLLAVAVLATIAFAVQKMQTDLGAQAQSSLRNTVLQCAVQCYAIEGSYPPDLDYLEEHYGLVYNKENYIVSYDVYASNELPDVTVLVR